VLPAVRAPCSSKAEQESVLYWCMTPPCSPSLASAPESPASRPPTTRAPVMRPRNWQPWPPDPSMPAANQGAQPAEANAVCPAVARDPHASGLSRLLVPAGAIQRPIATIGGLDLVI